VIIKKILKPKGIKGSFEGVAKYILDVKNNGEKCEKMMFSNFSFGDDNELNFKEAAMLQELHHSKKDPTYHFIVSFDKGETPDYDVFDKIEKELITALGFDECQRLSAIHSNTENFHLHVVINRVHPNTTRIVKEPLFDTNILQEKAVALEKLFLLKPTNHRVYDKQNSKASKQLPKQIADKEIYSGIQSFLSWIKVELQSKIKELIQDEKSTLKDLQILLAQYNLELRLRGAGLVVSDKNRKLFVKASDIDRALSKNNIEKRFGVFQQLESIPITPIKKYGQRDSALWVEYSKKKITQMDAKKAAIDEERKQRGKAYEKLQAYYRLKRQDVRDDYQMDKKTKFYTYRILSDRYVEESNSIKVKFAQYRTNIYQEYKYQTYTEFLQEKAKNGDSKAAEILLKRQSKIGENESSNTISSLDPSTIKLAPGANIAKNGQVYYMVGNKKILDFGSVLQVLKNHTKTTINKILEIASYKFGKAPVVIAGSKDFIEKVTENNKQQLNIVEKLQEKGV